MTKKMYKRELVRVWDNVRTKGKGEKNCFWANCYKCPLFKCCGDVYNAYEAVEVVGKWSKEHQQKHKISKLEFDILEAIFEERPVGSDYLKFSDIWILRRLLKKGYFNAATSETNVKYYFDNCEVKEDV